MTRIFVAIFVLIISMMMFTNSCGVARDLEDTDLFSSIHDAVQYLEHSDLFSYIDRTWDKLEQKTQAALEEIGIMQDDWDRWTASEREEAIHNASVTKSTT